MKNTTKKSIIQKIIISVLTIFILANFITPTISRAEDGDIADTVFSVLQKITVSIGDGIMWVVNGVVSGWNDAMSVYVYVANYDNWSEAQSNKLGFHYVEIPVFKVTPEKIFANEIDLLNVNIISASDGDGTIVGELKKVVSQWYQAFRGLVIVAMLSILVYVAIRIILSSTASDKAKYKTMIKDWLIGFAIIFFMHYIIAFSISAVELLSKAIKDSMSSNKEYVQEISGWSVNRINKEYQSNPDDGGSGRGIPAEVYNGGGDNNIAFHDFMSYIRWNASAGDAAPKSYGERFAYSVLYFLFIFYTVAFLYKYLKRVVTVVFLTVISPFVAFSYTLDKAKDGNAQGFSTWIKEFIFNLLIQPMHLLLYYVLVGSAMELAKEHMIYVAIVLGFLLPAEKMLREMFGFDKAKSVSSAFGGAMAGAGVMGALGAVKNMARALPGGNKPGGGNGGNGGKGAKDSEDNNQERIRMTDRKAEGDYNPTDAFNRQEDKEEENNNQRTDEEIMEQYGNDGYGQNANGEYFNPNTDEYDEDYNPLEDENYRNRLNEDNEQDEDEEDSEEPIRQQDAPEEPEEEQPEQSQEEPKIPFRQTKQARVIRGFGRALANNHKKYGGKFFARAGRGIASVTRGAMKVTGAAAGLTMGVAAGLASDDYSNVLKYGAAGLAGGAAIGGTVANAGIGAVKGTAGLAGGAAKGLVTAGKNFGTGIEEFSDDIARETLSKEDYQKRINARSDEKWKKNKEVRNKYADAFIGEDYKKVMADAQKYREAGITDDDIIISAMKAQVPGFKGGRTDAKRIAAANLSQYVSNEKDIENIGKDLKRDKIKSEDITQAQDLMRQIKKTSYRRRGRR
ncbi:MAG: hypothetical protein J6M60_06805 [Clostridia bacterium]|nr:hypothetical protein [Clostridia bacterium]